MTSLQVFQMLEGEKKEEEETKEKENKEGARESWACHIAPEWERERRLGGNDLGNSSKAICETLSQGP